MTSTSIAFASSPAASATTSSGNTGVTSPAISFLHRDVIHCILDFLTPREILYESISNISHSWNQSMRHYSVKRLSTPIRIVSRKLLDTMTEVKNAITLRTRSVRSISSSPSTNFVCALSTIACDRKWRKDLGEIEVTLAQFRDLLELLPGLRSFTCRIIETPPPRPQTKKQIKLKNKQNPESHKRTKSEKRRKKKEEKEKKENKMQQEQVQQQVSVQRTMPELATEGQLRELDLQVKWSSRTLNPLMSELCYFPYLERLTLSDINVCFDLAPLIQCTTLTAVILTTDSSQDAWDADGSDKQYRALASIPNLREFSINDGYLSPSLPSGIVFRELRYWHTNRHFTAWVIESIVKTAPNLRRLNKVEFSGGGFELLPQMKHLESIRVQLPREELCDIVDVLCRCPSVTHIEFRSHAPYSEEDWYRLLSSVPTLTSLAFRGSIVRPPIDKQRDPACIEKTSALQGLLDSERNRTLIARQIKICTGLAIGDSEKRAEFLALLKV